MNQSKDIIHDATSGISTYSSQQQQHDLLLSVTKTNSNVKDWTTPLVLSIIAGLSTCIGAAIVFCLDHPTSSLSSSSNGSNTNKRRMTATQLGISHMAFALTLAGSVMITVSIASILPESFLMDDDIHYTPFGSIDFYQRCIAFVVGCGLYMILSKFVFPAAPEEIIAGFTFSDKDDMESIEINNAIKLGGMGDRIRNSVSADDLILLLDDDDDDDESVADIHNGTLPLIITSISKTLQRKRAVGSSSFDSNDEPASVQGRRGHPRILLSAPTRKGKNDTHTRRCSVAYISSYMRGTDISDQEARRKWRVTMLLLVSLAVHNFPEGLAVAASALHSPRLGITTTIAIALHNIPEGIAIAIPCLAARPDLPWLAFGLASLSGLAEPLGAIVAILVIDQDSGDAKVNEAGSGTIQMLIWNTVFHMKNVLSFVAGIMMTVAIVELFPEARRHMKQSSTPGVLGTVLGALIMLASDAYLES